jgi:hypothetical protein
VKYDLLAVFENSVFRKIFGPKRRIQGVAQLGAK